MVVKFKYDKPKNEKYTEEAKKFYDAIQTKFNGGNNIGSWVYDNSDSICQILYIEIFRGKASGNLLFNFGGYDLNTLFKENYDRSVASLLKLAKKHHFSLIE